MLAMFFVIMMISFVACENAEETAKRRHMYGNCGRLNELYYKADSKIQDISRATNALADHCYDDNGNFIDYSELNASLARACVNWQKEYEGLMISSDRDHERYNNSINDLDNEFCTRNHTKLDLPSANPNLNILEIIKARREREERQLERFQGMRRRQAEQNNGG